VSAKITGSGTVTVAQYGGNPSRNTAAFRSANSYFDVFVAPGSALTAMTVVNCNLKGGNFVFWFDGSRWIRVSNQSYDGNTGCTTLFFDASTTPRLSQLTGTYFGTAIDFTPPVSTASATLGTAAGAAYAFNTWTNQDVYVRLSSADATDGSGLATFTYGATGAGAVAPVTSDQGVGALTIASQGSTTVTYGGADFAGNVEPGQTRAVLIDRTPPTVTISATPTQLWPANGKLVAVRVSGLATDDLSGVAGATYKVTDKYGDVQPSGAVSVQSSGAYAFTLNLPARRDGGDKDGRTFTVTVRVVDAAGNAQTATVQILVPHDQGKG
jgi:hypothetical protein